MKRTIAGTIAFALVALMTIAAQAESKGEPIFKQKCAMCHVVNGKGGKIGPDLSKIASGMKEKEIMGQLENPKKRNPSTSMPSFKSLSKVEMDALVGYLKTLK